MSKTTFALKLLYVNTSSIPDIPRLLLAFKGNDKPFEQCQVLNLTSASEFLLSLDLASTRNTHDLLDGSQASGTRGHSNKLALTDTPVLTSSRKTNSVVFPIVQYKAHLLTFLVPDESWHQHFLRWGIFLFLVFTLSLWLHSESPYSGLIGLARQLGKSLFLFQPSFSF